MKKVDKKLKIMYLKLEIKKVLLYQLYQEMKKIKKMIFQKLIENLVKIYIIQKKKTILKKSQIIIKVEILIIETK